MNVAVSASAPELECFLPCDLEWARGALLRRTPAWSRVDEVTGLNVTCPWEALHAIAIFEQSVRNGMPISGCDESLIERALSHYGDALSQRCIWRLPTLLGARSERHLAPLLELRWAEDWVRDALHSVGPLTFETLHAAVKRRHASAEWVRRALALSPAFLDWLRTQDAALALHVEALADGQLDVGQLRDAWQCVCSTLPVWSRPLITIAGAMPRDHKLAFLTDNQTREFVEAIQIQIFAAHENAAAGLWSLHTLDAQKRLLLIRDPETRGCQLVASAIALREAVLGAIASECMLVLPHVRHVLTHLGRVAAHIDGERPHRLAMRVGGLKRVLWDRPYLVVDWSVEREEALGVGLVIEGAPGSVFY